jgi:hypothetical protein
MADAFKVSGAFFYTGLWMVALGVLFAAIASRRRIRTLIARRR